MKPIIILIFGLLLLPYAGIPNSIDQFIIFFLIIILVWFIFEYAKKNLDSQHVHIPIPHRHKRQQQEKDIPESSREVVSEALDLKNDPITPSFFTEEDKNEIKKAIQSRAKKEKKENSISIDHTDKS